MDEYFVESKSGFDKLMDFLVFIAVLAVTIFLVLEIIGSSGVVTSINADKVNNIYFYANIVIFAIFFVDLVRLWRASSGAKDFFSHNWLDVLATIPFGMLATLANYSVLNGLKWARVLRFTKLQKASKISKISKEFKAASHLKNESEEYQKKHRL